MSEITQGVRAQIATLLSSKASKTLGDSLSDTVGGTSFCLANTRFCQLRGLFSQCGEKHTQAKGVQHLKINRYHLSHRSTEKTQDSIERCMKRICQNPILIHDLETSKQKKPLSEPGTERFVLSWLKSIHRKPTATSRGGHGRWGLRTLPLRDQG